MSTPLQNYLSSTTADNINAAMVAYVANLQQVAATGPAIAATIVKELETQRAHLKLIAAKTTVP